MRSSILMLGLVVGEVAAGCGFRSHADAPDSGAGSDSDGGTDGGCASFANLVDTCKLTFDADLMLTMQATYDTDSHVLTVGGTSMPVTVKTAMIGTDQVDVISARNVVIGAPLRGNGSHGLVIVANNDFTVAAEMQIDVSNGGAGAQASCGASGATRGQDSTGGASGGGGGGFGADGGQGGDGNHDGSLTQGGTKGQAVSQFPPGFHGGCPGGDGGTGDSAGGTGGKGGGALYIVAANHITLLSSAPLNAGGGGGHGGVGVVGGASNTGDAGGGGGGSGGLLLVEAPHIMGVAATIITANGGAGGGGSSSQGPGVDGNPGTVNVARAAGGPGAGTASDGGDGGSGSGTNQTGGSVMMNADGGGGGGGGGVGFIRVRSTDVQLVQASPASR